MMNFHLDFKPTASVMVHPNSHPDDSDIIEIDPKSNLVKNISIQEIQMISSETM